MHVLRTLEDALGFREALRTRPRLAIVGSGFVGAEAAAVARELGSEVTMVTDVAVPLADALGPELGRMLSEVHLERGVSIVAGMLVEEILAENGRATGVRLADGRVVEADEVLVGIGARPGTTWLEGSGIPVGNGVECDSTLYAGSGCGRPVTSPAGCIRAPVSRPGSSTGPTPPNRASPWPATFWPRPVRRCPSTRCRTSGPTSTT